MLKYIKGVKYQVAEDYTIKTPILNHSIKDPLFTLKKDGTLTVLKGFCWDGASGPTIDTKSSMEASLVHDVFCICMRDGRISYEKYQDEINKFFMDMCIQAGMPQWRAKLWFWGVEFGDAGNPNQGKDREILEV